MICYHCQKECNNDRTDDHDGWSPVWIDASCGPVQICVKCLKYYQQPNILIDEEATTSFKEVLLFLHHTKDEFKLTKDLVLNTGKVMEGEPLSIGTLMGHVLFKLNGHTGSTGNEKGEYWIVTLFTLLKVTRKFVDETRLEWY